MSTRTGDLDPEVILYLLQHEHIPVTNMKELLNKRAGLLAISERSDDMKDLLEYEDNDTKCKFAVEYFCYHLAKHMGALIAALGGLDMLVFTAGMGEKSPAIRKRICDKLSFMGVTLDDSANERNNNIISSVQSNVVVRVLNTNEELVIAKHSSKFV